MDAFDLEDAGEIEVQHNANFGFDFLNNETISEGYSNDNTIFYKNYLII
ncbi:hypothetical protein [Flavobacterium sp.]